MAKYVSLFWKTVNWWTSKLQNIKNDSINLAQTMLSRENMIRLPVPNYSGQQTGAHNTLDNRDTRYPSRLYGSLRVLNNNAGHTGCTKGWNHRVDYEKIIICSRNVFGASTIRCDLQIQAKLQSLGSDILPPANWRNTVICSVTPDLWNTLQVYLRLPYRAKSHEKNILKRGEVK